jgi:hypothetical protein
VNFVFHHHLALLDSGDPEVALGAMLPDLLRIIDRSLRTPRSAVAAWPREADGLERVVLGVEHHHDVDAWFHDTPAFARGEAGARDRLVATGWARAGLFAHVAWELCLDGALLDARREAPEATSSARALGEASALSPLATRLLDARFSELPSSVRAIHAERLTRLLARLVELASGYSEARGLFLRLEGLRRALRLPETDASTRERVVRALDELLTLARPDVEELRSAWRTRASPR